MRTPYSVYIIILNWKNITDTIACLDSLSTIDYENYTILLVNNDEGDFPADIQKQYSRLIAINNHANLGFCKGNNIGIRYALEKQADFILILNNDTSVDRNFLRPLVEHSSQHPQTILSPAIFKANSNDIENYGGKLLWFIGIIQRIKKQESRSPDYLSGACLFVKSEYFKDIGTFDEDYFAYAEDADWGLRAKRKGYSLKIIYESRIWHKHSSSTKDRKGWAPIKAYYLARNNILLGKKNWKGWPRWRWIISYLLLGSQLHLLFFCRSFETLQAHFRGIKEGLEIPIV